MKKLITFFLILTLVVPAAALADLPDISGLSQDELIELSHQIQLRLFNEKLVNGVVVPVGTYIIGEDIPEGSYRLELETPLNNSMITINSKNKGKVIGSHLLGEIYGFFEVGKITLEKDQVIEITFGPLKIYPYTGLFN